MLFALWLGLNVQGYLTCPTPAEVSRNLAGLMPSRATEPSQARAYLSPTAVTSIPFDCVKWDLCLTSMICKCSPAGCVVDYEDSGYKTSFDVLLANGSGNGSMTGIFGDHNVHFTKDQ